MERLLPDQTLSNDDRALLHFGLATVMDRAAFIPRPRCTTKPPTFSNPPASPRARFPTIRTSMPGSSIRSSRASIRTFSLAEPAGAHPTRGRSSWSVSRARARR